MRLAMSRRPQKRKSPDPNKEFLVLHGPGYWVLPDVISCEGVDRGRGTNLVVIRASTYEDRRLAIVLSISAVASLVAAPLIEVGFETPVTGSPIVLSLPGKTLGLPAMDRFVSFRAIADDLRSAEFSNEKNQHILVSFSSTAYVQLLEHSRDVSSR